MKFMRSDKEQFLDFLKVEEARRRLREAVDHLEEVLDDVEQHIKEVEDGGIKNYKH